MSLTVTVSKISVALVVGLASVLSGDPARAAPQVLVTLEYDVPPDPSGCPGVDQFRASVQHQLGYDPFRPAADRHVAVQIARKDVGFEGRTRWTDADGNWVGDRRLSSRQADCRHLATSVAFSVAVQIQLLSALTAGAPEPTPPPAPPRAETPAPEVAAKAPAPPPPPPAPAAVATAAPEPMALFAGLGPSLAVGIGPEATGVGRLFVRGRRDRLSFEVGLDAALPATQTRIDSSGFSLDRFAGSAAGCGHARAFAFCITGTLGVLRARGFGVDTPATSSGLFSQVGARVAATRDFGDRYFLSVRADGLLMVSTATVTLDDRTTWTAPRVGALIGLDVGARLF